jgi:hypothetical protein
VSAGVKPFSLSTGFAIGKIDVLTDKNAPQLHPPKHYVGRHEH